jgi:hypothetical protein
MQRTKKSSDWNRFIEVQVKLIAICMLHDGEGTTCPLSRLGRPDDLQMSISDWTAHHSMLTATFKYFTKEATSLAQLGCLAFPGIPSIAVLR